LKFRNLFAGAAVAALLCAQSPISGSAVAQDMGMGWSGMGGMHGEKSHFMMLLHSANLSPGQQSQIQQIFRANAEPMHALKQQSDALHEQIANKLLAPGRLSASDLKPLIEQQSRLQEQMDESMLDTAVSIRAVLTPEQLSKLAQVHQQLLNLHNQMQTLMGSQAGETEHEN
jgi:Spy/CpxP family protein refolding chaperone